MQFLLTSGGFHNATLREALAGMLGKPICEASAFCVPTALHAMPGGGGAVYRAVSAAYPSAMCGLGWKSLGVLELTALPSLKPEYWVPAVREADALLFEGGDSFYLTHWVRESGLAELLPSLRPEAIWVGLSAGSMAAGPNIIAPEPGESIPPTGSGVGLGLVDFAILPHMDHERFPENAMAELETLAARMPVPTYLLDDQSAVKVTAAGVEVVTEGKWKLCTP
ncbi:MAG TPA: Type 1 glutamine amidotransferase-like domain-containing protein [Caulobacteraceae bacterium]|nr:Type 1 glutamine amidotransferase-like domain-containing protein [Caulobacteraceae bacterium]